jgi:hypothetical protein
MRTVHKVRKVCKVYNVIEYQRNHLQERWQAVIEE